MKIPYNHHPGGIKRSTSLSDRCPSPPHFSDKYTCNSEDLERLAQFKGVLFKSYDSMEDRKPKLEKYYCFKDEQNIVNRDSYVYQDLDKTYIKDEKPFLKSPSKGIKMEDEFDQQFTQLHERNHRYQHQQQLYEDYNNPFPIGASSINPQNPPPLFCPRMEYEIPTLPSYSDSESFHNSLPSAESSEPNMFRTWTQRSADGYLTNCSTGAPLEHQHLGCSPSSLDLDLDQPLDLTIRTFPADLFGEDNPYSEDGDSSRLQIDDQARSSSDSPNGWLKKIKTGTRSRVRSPKSWEFLARLLHDPQSNPSMIKWEDKELGTFRLVNKEEIARIWGTRSNKSKNGGVSYDNFARNIRYHYKTLMMVPVSEKHLVYKFGEKIMESIRRGDFMEE